MRRRGDLIFSLKLVGLLGLVGLLCLEGLEAVRHLFL